MALAEAPQIGTSQIDLIPLEDIAVGILQRIPWPTMRYYPERRRVRLTSGKYTGIGAPYIVWHWDYLKAEWRHTLRDYLAGGVSTANLYVESQKNDDDDSDGADDWAQFEVIGTWPEGDENKDATRRVGGFDLEFEVVEELTPIYGIFHLAYANNSYLLSLV